jgi:hypothetical protein
MKKHAAFAVPLLAGGLFSACSSLGLKEESEARAAKFTGNHAALARCVVTRLQADSRWVIRNMQYKVLAYQEIAATEVYAYPLGALPGTYARNSPSNPDAVRRYGPPDPEIRTDKPETATTRDESAGYSFVLTLKRTDNTTVFATLNGKKYAGGIAWDKLKSCEAT